MFLPLLTGFALVVVTVLIHTYGAWTLVRLLDRSFADELGVITRHRAAPAIATTALVLLLLHWVEILIWACAYLLLEPVAPIATFEAAVYFSAVTFTTLGYGDITLGVEQWRLLSGIEALDGVLLLGLSTAILFAVVHQIWRDELPSARRRVADQDASAG
jgi:hypothetical protein